MTSKLAQAGQLNDAVMSQLRLCIRILDKMGYQATAAHVSAAIDAMVHEARSEAELSALGLEQDKDVQLAAEAFANQNKKCH